MRIFAAPLALALLAVAGAAPAGAPLGTAAPPITATTLEGATLEPSVTAGKVTILNFWATWCPPCRAETPDLIAAYRKLHADDVVFLGLDTTETAPIVKTFLSAKGVPFPSALAGPDVYNAYGISYIPTTIVLDPQGIVRARWIGGVTPAQLATYVAAARAGKNSVFISPLQTKIDALLAPSRFDFAGTPAHQTAQVATMNKTIARVETLVDKDDGKSVDYERTQRAEGELRIKAGTAMRASATTPKARAAADMMLARGYGARNDWSTSAQLYRDALAAQPNDPAIVAALSRSLYRLHDYAGMIAQARRYTELKPHDGDGWSDLGLSFQRTKQFSQAIPAYETSLRLLKADAAAKPTQDALADVADTSLDLADVYVSLGDSAGARRTFAQANAYGDRLTAGGEYARLKRNVKERTQEGLIAVALAGGNGRPVLSIAPWSGPDLPGSVASTLKYRLIVAAAADSDVQLAAGGLRPEWIASFCADGLCSPQRVAFKVPQSGVKTYEFQLVPPAPGADPGTVTVHAAGGATVTLPAAR